MISLYLLIGSYILGAIPFGLLVSYGVKGIDIRKFGSGNIGATNVFRVVGKKWGILVFILDFLKGFLIPIVIKNLPLTQYPPLLIPASFLTVLGHCFSPFLKFKGGKGVATALGVMAGLSLFFSKLGVVIIISLIIWGGVLFIFKYVSLASITSAFCFFILSYLLHLNREIKLLSFLLFFIILIKHKENIKRLLASKEHRVS